MYHELNEESKKLIIKHLINNLQSEKRDIKAYSIKILSRIGGSDIFNVLRQLVDDNDWIIKLYLIKALDKFESLEVAETLQILQKDSDTDVREAATEMLSRLNC
jgi:HEAT repeat protein